MYFKNPFNSKFPLPGKIRSDSFNTDNSCKEANFKSHNCTK